MSTTETAICNRALGRIGEERILDITDAGSAGRACQLHFADTRDEVLRSHRWNFATARAVLSQLAEDPVFGYDFQYGLPSDFIRALEVNDSEDGISPIWVVEGNKLLTDEETVNLVYIFRETVVTRWDPLFQEAVTLKLASKLATVLRGSSSQVVEFMEEYAKLTAPLARRIDGNEGQERRGMAPLRSAFIAARYNGI